jgi:CheY-like chemotaxis protein
MIRCLLVAGDKEARDVIKVGLEQTGAFEIETAEDAWAFEMVKTTPYRVVVVDTTLSDGGDGIELLRRVREALPQAELLLISRGEGQRTRRSSASTRSSRSRSRRSSSSRRSRASSTA